MLQTHEVLVAILQCLFNKDKSLLSGILLLQEGKLYSLDSKGSGFKPLGIRSCVACY